MTPSCVWCGASGLPEASRFCPFCGVGLPDRAEPAATRAYTPPHLLRDVLGSASAREGERKRVTVLFADIAGSLAMAESLDPEDIHAIMDGFFVRALEAVHAEGGTINQFRGDGFMALFGAPRAREEEVARALRAALAICTSTEVYEKQVRERFGVPVPLRIGMHSGTVWVGSIGMDLRRDYTAEGPTVGLAARLEQAAAPGQILLSEETARRAGAGFELRELGERRIRGFSRPVRVFELRGARRNAARFEVERALGLSAFVGRERELAWLSLGEPARSRPALRVIAGEAGIGKSRLLHEHLSRTRGDAALQACCRESETAHAYAPWLRLLGEWPAELPGAERAAGLLRRFGGNAAEVSGTRDVFSAELGKLLEPMASEGGIRIVLDDAHWLDPSSRYVLAALASSTALRGAQFLLTARVDPGQIADVFGERASAIELGPLAPGESEALCRSNLAGLGDPDPYVAFAVRRAGGNPLFLEEIARSLCDGPEGLRRWARLEQELSRSPLRLPETLHGVIAARIDALPDAAKRALQAGSVVGTPFDPALLEKIDERCGQDCASVLARLVVAGLLEPAAEGRFDFRHVLMREVAYGQLLLSRRRAMHAACAEALIERGTALTADGAASIGAHFERAALPEPAAEYMTTAGKAYLRLHAPDEAVAQLARAWELQPPASGAGRAARASIGLALASALNGLDRAGEAGEVLEALARDRLDLEQRRDVARACIEEGWVRFSEKNQADAGRRLIERGLGLLPNGAAGRRVEMGAHAYLVRLNSLDADVARAVQAADRLSELAREADDAFYRVFALGSKASALCHRGDLEGSWSACSEAVRLADQAESDLAIGLVYSFLAEVLVYRGETREALRAADRAREAGERSHQTGAVYHAAIWSSEAHLLDGNPAAAAAEVERLATINRSWPSTARWRALTQLALGCSADALASASECLAAHPPRLLRARTLWIQGLSLARARPDAARSGIAPVRESIELCESLELRPHLAEAEAALGELYAALREVAEARIHAMRAVRLYEGCGMLRHARRVRERLPSGVSN